MQKEGRGKEREGPQREGSVDASQQISISEQTSADSVLLRFLSYSVSPEVQSFLSSGWCLKRNIPLGLTRLAGSSI